MKERREIPQAADMSLRDYFIGQALTRPNSMETAAESSAWACELADAALKARETKVDEVTDDGVDRDHQSPATFP